MSVKGPVIRDVTPADTAAVRAFVHGILAEFGLEPDTGGIDADLDDPAGAYADGVFDLILDEDGRLAGTAALKPLDADTADTLTATLALWQRIQAYLRLTVEGAFDPAEASDSLLTGLKRAAYPGAETDMSTNALEKKLRSAATTCHRIFQKTIERPAATLPSDR